MSHVARFFAEEYQKSQGVGPPTRLTFCCSTLSEKTQTHKQELLPLGSTRGCIDGFEPPLPRRGVEQKKKKNNMFCRAATSWEREEGEVHNWHDERAQVEKKA